MRRYRLSVVLEFDENLIGEALSKPERVVKAVRGSFASLAAIERKKLLYGPEPWRAWAPNAGPNDLVCCSGTARDECGCGGLTQRESADENRKAKGFSGRVVGFVVHEREITRWRLLEAS